MTVNWPGEALHSGGGRQPDHGGRRGGVYIGRQCVSSCFSDLPNSLGVFGEGCGQGQEPGHHR